MTDALNLLLAEIKTATECEAIRGDVLPLPPSSFPDKMALLVNCYFRTEDVDLDAPALLEIFREHANRAFVTIEGFVRNHDLEFDTIGVAVFHNSGDVSRVKDYWANSRKDLLSRCGTRVTSEGSHSAEIRCLLST
jgi:hypothetical protein